MFYECNRRDESPQYELPPAPRYVPLFGWFVGCVSAGCFLILELFMPRPVAILGALIAGILLSRGIHERGFASLCDALGGGWTREDVLRIAGDSRIGSYGAVGLVLFLLLEFQLLLALPDVLIPWVLPAGHALGRFSILPVVYFLKPATEKDFPKVTTTDLFIGFGLGTLFTFFIAVKHPWMLLAPLLVFIPISMAVQRLRKRIGGFIAAGLSTVHLAARVSVYAVLVISTHFLLPPDFFRWKF